jgi:hypothetical protein
VYPGAFVTAVNSNAFATNAVVLHNDGRLVRMICMLLIMLCVCLMLEHGNERMTKLTRQIRHLNCQITCLKNMVQEQYQNQDPNEYLNPDPNEYLNPDQNQNQSQDRDNEQNQDPNQNQNQH